MENELDKLSNDENSVFYLETVLTKNILKKFKKSKYKNDKIFHDKWFNKSAKTSQKKDASEEQKILDNLPNKNIPQVTQTVFNNETLFHVTTPMSNFHGDVADLTFINPSASEPRYALVMVDLFSSFVFFYPMKNKYLLKDKLELFYQEISKYKKYKEIDIPVRIQTDQEFRQNEIDQLNEKNNVIMFNTNINRGHAFAAEQKIKILKGKFTSLLKNKKFDKRYKTKILSNIAKNMNLTPNKYKLTPVETIKLWTDGKNLDKIQNMRLQTISRLQRTRDRGEFKLERSKKYVLRELNIGDKVLIPAYRLKKSSDPGKLTKATTRKKEFFNRENLYKVSSKKLIKTDGLIKFYSYTVNKFSSDEKINENFKREELYAITNNVVLNKNK